MTILISHRGNIDGEFHELENNPTYIESAIKLGYDVEIDVWYINGKLHRINGPAKKFSSGDKEWWVNGKRHREDGPAVEWSDGGIEWWVNGKRIELEF